MEGDENPTARGIAWRAVLHFLGLAEFEDTEVDHHNSGSRMDRQETSPRLLAYLVVYGAFALSGLLLVMALHLSSHVSMAVGIPLVVVAIGGAYVSIASLEVLRDEWAVALGGA